MNISQSIWNHELVSTYFFPNADITTKIQSLCISYETYYTSIDDRIGMQNMLT